MLFRSAGAVGIRVDAESPSPDASPMPGAGGTLTVALTVDDATGRLGGIDLSIDGPLVAALGGSATVGLALAFDRYGDPVKVPRPKKAVPIE